MHFVFLNNFIRLSLVEFRKSRDGFIMFLLQDANLLDETIDFLIDKLEAMRKRRRLIREAKGIDDKKEIKMPMTYPSLAEVKQADREQLACWYRFLESPGSSAIHLKDYRRKSTKEEDKKFDETYRKETQIMNLVVKRFREAGEFTPEISRKVGCVLPEIKGRLE